MCCTETGDIIYLAKGVTRVHEMVTGWKRGVSRTPSFRSLIHCGTKTHWRSPDISYNYNEVT